MLWKMAVHSRPILQVFFFIKRRERKVMNPIFQHRIIRSFPRGWIVAAISLTIYYSSRDLFLVSRKGDIFSSFSPTYLHRSRISSIFKRGLNIESRCIYGRNDLLLLASCEIFSLLCTFARTRHCSWINAVLILRSRVRNRENSSNIALWSEVREE